MASRRDELNAYTFAKKRTVAAFLQPSPTGTEEGAPSPLRAVVPGLVVGALILAGFGAWGMFKPSAPKDWARPNTHVIVGKDSTTRYVVLNTPGADRKSQTLLHPVLNLASARLLLTPRQGKVVQVPDKILDAGRPPRGPVLGIPYAPDRLPSDTEAAKAKRWAVCEQPGGGKGASVQKAAFIFAERDFSRTEGKRRLTGGEVLYVQGQKDRARFLVDAAGTKYQLRETGGGHLTRALVGDRAPQPVTDDWLATLHTGSPVEFPEITGTVSADAGVGGGLTGTQDRVGMVLLAQTGAGAQHYVVLPGRVRPVTAFTAWLLINSPQTDVLDMAGRAATVDAASFTPESEFFGAQYRWPRRKAVQVNSAGGEDARDTVCSVLREVDDQGGTTLSTWAGPSYPADITASGTSTYVTPGSGLLYTQVRGRQTRPDGSLFLVTDTGLRYALQSNGDSVAAPSDIGTGGRRRERDGRPEPSQAQIRLGYEKVVPGPVPLAWSEFLSRGPRLDTNSARQPQGS